MLPAPPAVLGRFMALAVEQALRGVGRTHPNPPVGAIVVRDGEIVGRGFHHRVGLPHAEVEALRDAGERARGAEIYVTLEPCNHHGRTPPCTEAILSAGISRVFIGSSDPNPLVSGRGIERLRVAGVEVQAGVERELCDSLIRSFVKHITTRRPFVVLKAAATLDGKIATRTGHSRWVTGAEARRQVHVWRDEFDAVLVGAQTVRADNPLLTTRLEQPAVEGRLPRNPVRIVLMGAGDLPPSSQVFDVSAGPVLVAAPGHRVAALESIVARGVEVLPLPSEGGRVSLPALLDALGQRGLTSLIVEGGAQVHAAFLQAGQVDEVRLFLAPRILGGDGLSWIGPLGVSQVDRSWTLDGISVQQVGADLLLTGRPRSPEA